MIFIQHGGEYGFVRTSVAYPMVEYRQHRFMTWGWTRHGDMPGNFLPLPHPQLAAIRGAHRETKPQLLLVGTEMALLPYTLKSMLRGRQFFAYREDKARFLAALDPDMRIRTQYRPYFDVPSSLAEHGASGTASVRVSSAGAGPRRDHTGAGACGEHPLFVVLASRSRAFYAGSSAAARRTA